MGCDHSSKTVNQAPDTLVVDNGGNDSKTQEKRIFDLLKALVDSAALDTTPLQGYKPERSIPFSHKVHGGDLKMDCQYCHQPTDTKNLGKRVPLMLCEKCHYVKTQDLKKLEYYDQLDSISQRIER